MFIYIHNVCTSINIYYESYNSSLMYTSIHESYNIHNLNIGF